MAQLPASQTAKLERKCVHTLADPWPFAFGKTLDKVSVSYADNR